MYENKSLNAILAMERERTGNYGMDYECDTFCEDDMAFMRDGWDDADEEYDEFMAIDK